MLLNGFPLGPVGHLPVGVNWFLAGGDNFFLAKGTNKADSGQVDLEAMVDYSAVAPANRHARYRPAVGRSEVVGDGDGTPWGTVPVNLSSFEFTRNEPAAGTAGRRWASSLTWRCHRATPTVYDLQRLWPSSRSRQIEGPTLDIGDDHRDDQSFWNVVGAPNPTPRAPRCSRFPGRGGRRPSGDRAPAEGFRQAEAGASRGARAASRNGDRRVRDLRGVPRAHPRRRHPARAARAARRTRLLGPARDAARGRAREARAHRRVGAGRPGRAPSLLCDGHHLVHRVRRGRRLEHACRAPPPRQRARRAAGERTGRPRSRVDARRAPRRRGADGGGPHARRPRRDAIAAVVVGFVRRLTTIAAPLAVPSLRIPAEAPRVRLAGALLHAALGSRGPPVVPVAA